MYAVGRRKTAVAQVRLYKKGTGKVTINGKDVKVAFPLREQQEKVEAPLQVVGQLGKLDVSVKVSGGGQTSQSEAVRHGLSRALVELNQNFRKPLKKSEFLTRDARRKERKKPGLKRARKAPQFSKR
ncbi:MAG: 30S ribosomal protein S9 [Parcubacteria group bacterium]